MKEKTQERLHSFHKINITNYTDSRQEKKGENRKLNTNYERGPYFDWALGSYGAELSSTAFWRELLVSPPIFWIG